MTACNAPACSSQADFAIDASGPSGEFSGHLCDRHYRALESCMSFSTSSVQYLPPVSLERVLGALP